MLEKEPLICLCGEPFYERFHEGEGKFLPAKFCPWCGASQESAERIRAAVEEVLMGMEKNGEA